MDLLLVVLLAILAIAVTTALARRLGVAGPLLLVGIGIAVALLPFTTLPVIDPDLILIGVLPPLLYAAAVRMPAIEFRRDLGSIAGLSIVLVVVSSLVLGLFFSIAIPELGFPAAVAIGAILSPTDAVATSIAKRLGLSPRVVTLLEGESLLNDATALVLLRTAIAAIAGGFSLWGAAAAFAWAVLAALVVGAVVGLATLRLRAWVHNSAANTAIGFTVPFLAYLPTEYLGGSGLVAAVVAGLVTGQLASRWFTPEQRLSDELNWRTIELVLEGGVFLVMGLELKDVVTQNVADDEGLWHGAWLAASALGIILAVRAAYVALMVWRQSRRATRLDRDELARLGERIAQAADDPDAFAAAQRAAGRRIPRGARTAEAHARRVDSLRTRIARLVADVDYYQGSPIGWRHGTVIVWAGMRGVVTLAAAQTLPRDGSVDGRALLVFVAFLVAVGGLMLQGFTLPWLVRRLGLAHPGGAAASGGEDERLDDELRRAAASALADPDLARPDGRRFSAPMLRAFASRLDQPPAESDADLRRERFELRLRIIEAQRARLNELSSDGTFSTGALRHALAELDAAQLSLELRLGE